MLLQDLAFSCKVIYDLARTKNCCKSYKNLARFDIILQDKSRDHHLFTSCKIIGCVQDNARYDRAVCKMPCKVMI